MRHLRQIMIVCLLSLRNLHTRIASSWVIVAALILVSVILLSASSVEEGIQLAYGRCTGFSSYGKEGFPRGARLIRLTAGQRGFETKVILDDAGR